MQFRFSLDSERKGRFSLEDFAAMPALNIDICQGYSTFTFMFFVSLYMPDFLKTKVTRCNYTTCSPTGFKGIWEGLFFWSCFDLFNFFTLHYLDDLI